jgi:hypothetical protein
MKKTTTTLITPTRRPQPGPTRKTWAARRRRATDFITRAIKSFNKIFNRPFAFILLALAILLAINEKTVKSPATTILTELINDIPKGKIQTYLQAAHFKIIAFLAYISVTSAALPASQLFSGLLISILLAFIVPEKTPWEYAIQTILLFFFVALKRPTDRLIIIAAGAAAWWAGWIAIS